MSFWKYTSSPAHIQHWDKSQPEFYILNNVVRVCGLFLVFVCALLLSPWMVQWFQVGILPHYILTIITDISWEPRNVSLSAQLMYWLWEILEELDGQLQICSKLELLN